MNSGRAAREGLSLCARFSGRITRHPETGPPHHLVVSRLNHELCALQLDLSKIANARSDGKGITWLPCCRPGESSRFQPVVEFINPVVAAGSLLSHAEAMAAGAENVSFRFNARRL